MLVRLLALRLSLVYLLRLQLWLVAHSLMVLHLLLLNLHCIGLWMRLVWLSFMWNWGAIHIGCIRWLLRHYRLLKKSLSANKLLYWILALTILLLLRITHFIVRTCSASVSSHVSKNWCLIHLAHLMLLLRGHVVDLLLLILLNKAIVKHFGSLDQTVEFIQAVLLIHRDKLLLRLGHLLSRSELHLNLLSVTLVLVLYMLFMLLGLRLVHERLCLAAILIWNLLEETIAIAEARIIDLLSQINCTVTLIINLVKIRINLLRRSQLLLLFLSLWVHCMGLVCEILLILKKRVLGTMVLILHD